MTFSAHLSVLFADVPVAERPAAARSAGYEAVESWWLGQQTKTFVGEIHRCGLRLVLLNAECGDISAGDRGFVNVPHRRQQVISDIAEAVALGPAYVNVLVGRGNGLDHVVDVLREVAQEPADVILLVEHANERDVPGYLLPTPMAAATLVERVESSRLRLLYDAYHAQMAGLDPPQDVVRYEHVLGHVHYSEAPDRGAPRRGFSRFITALERMDYNGDVGLEYVPTEAFRAPPDLERSSPG
jgi:hydroxypyruvate isomerase